jgi:hypothetical protein
MRRTDNQEKAGKKTLGHEDYHRREKEPEDRARANRETDESRFRPGNFISDRCNVIHL